MRPLGSGKQTAEQTRGSVGSGETWAAAGRRGAPRPGSLPPVPQDLASPSFLPLSSQFLFFGLFPPPVPSVPDLSDYPQIPLLLIRVSCLKENWVGGSLSEN